MKRDPSQVALKFLVAVAANYFGALGLSLNYHLPPDDVEALITKVRQIGSMISESNGPLEFEWAVNMLFHRLEATG